MGVSIKSTRSILVLLPNACGALLFSFFAPYFVSLIGTGRPQKKETKKGLPIAIGTGPPINIQLPISFHSSGQADIGEEAMWIGRARYTVNHFFDIEQRCPDPRKVI